MIDEAGGRADPDAIAALLAQLRSGSVGVRDRAAREMLSAVHRAVYPLCLKLLGNAEDAYDVEAETMARLLARTGVRDAAPIVHGAAYARQIARHVCGDLRRESRRRHDRPVDDLDEDQVPSVADHAATVHPPVSAPTLLDRDLIAMSGYTSPRALADLECLTRDELKAVILRQQGYSYARIAGMDRAGLTTAAAEKQGERGAHKLRGLVHVVVWRQRPPATWADPPCPVLAELQGQVRQQLQAGRPLTASLYLQIGRHLDPDPNRRPGDGSAPRCPLCVAERERSRREYWWLLIMLLPFPEPVRPAPTGPVVLVADVEDAPPAVLPGRRRRRAPWAAAAAVLFLLIAVGVLVAPHVRAQQDAASTSAAAGATGAVPGTGPSRRGGQTRDPARTGPTSGPGGSGAPTGQVSPGDHPTGDPTGGPVEDRTTDPPGDGAGANNGANNGDGPGDGNGDGNGANNGDGPGDGNGDGNGDGGAAPPPGECDDVPAGGGPYRPFVGSAGGLCWQASGGWLPLAMSGLRAEPQNIGAVDVDGGRAVFFTATDNYVRGTVVDGAGNVSGWHLFRARADGYAYGFNISSRQPVTAVVSSPDTVDLFAVGLDEVVWYRRADVRDLDGGQGWRTLLDSRAFGDGGRFWTGQTLGVSSAGTITGYAKDNVAYQGCAPYDPGQFRWIGRQYDCSANPPPR